MEIELKSDIDVHLVQSCGGDRSIAYAARVSTGKLFDDPSDDKEISGLINYLMKHRHGTPFEHSSMTFCIRAPIFVWREWHRHRIGFSYNEESGRYKTLDPVFYVPAHDRPMKKVENWKAARPKFEYIDDRETEISHNKLKFNLDEVYLLAYRNYLKNLELGIDPGLARICLPVAIYSSCWVTCNPRSLMAFLSLRTFDPDAKFVSYPLYEIEMAARQCEKMLAEYWPLTYKAFIANGRVAP